MESNTIWTRCTNKELFCLIWDIHSYNCDVLSMSIEKHPNSMGSIFALLFVCKKILEWQTWIELIAVDIDKDIDIIIPKTIPTSCSDGNF